VRDLADGLNAYILISIQFGKGGFDEAQTGITNIADRLLYNPARCANMRSL
jgi:hypothetical protein